MTPKQQLEDMLVGARPAEDYQQLTFERVADADGTTLTVHSGPDDAIAVFRFSQAGDLLTVEVLES